ncbi:MAG: hypothetical protein H6851_07595 [Geminicoccaceae bacterium]|nr:hypothetical protein [Geminicoccaceae bacterium]
MFDSRAIRQDADSLKVTDPNWRQRLISTKNGIPRECLANVACALRHDPPFAGNIRLDELRNAIVCRGMPWESSAEWCEWTDLDGLRLTEWLQLGGIPAKPRMVADACDLVAEESGFHPVRDYLESLQWDGVPRLDSWLAEYLGCVDGDRRYISEVGRRWLISAVARIFKPGCKADCILILEGRQGTGKSTALASLMPDIRWFADQIADLGTKDSAQDIRGKWLIEISELSAMRRGEIERTKAFVSRGVDHYRPSFGRWSKDFPRQCVFAGTTNDDAYLVDETGNRRFWPVRVGRINIVALNTDRDQLWAEAIAAYRSGEPWWLDKEMEHLAAAAQAERSVRDPWHEDVIAIAREKAAGRAATPTGPCVQLDEILQALGVERKDRDNSRANRVARVLKAEGWMRKQRTLDDGTRSWVYMPPQRQR